MCHYVYIDYVYVIIVFIVWFMYNITLLFICELPKLIYLLQSSNT